MKKRSRGLTLFLSVIMMVSLLSACGGNGNNGTASTDAGNSGSSNGGSEPKKDTITALLPPVSANYQARFTDMEKEFNALHPNLTLKIEPASWEDMTQKLDTQ